jgi:hypothetical protein
MYDRELVLEILGQIYQATQTIAQTINKMIIELS